MTSPQPEILAPAGSLEAFFAALESGADAVYVGLKDFSARAKAKNFTLDELGRMVAYAHRDGRRVYLALNTLLKEDELPRLVEVLAAVDEMKIDAVILQDLAVWRMAREHFPELELHASTQLTIHNAAGVKMLERMGFARVVLARELSLEEVGLIREQTTLGLEHFIHGAHCFSLSGQCFFSSWLGGMSGSRGRCTQPCRRRHGHRGKEGYYFSPNDLSSIDMLPDLAAAGVTSFKIEGRMKSAEYVYSVVTAYRQALNASSTERAEVLAGARRLLKRSFGRPSTHGFLTGGRPTDMVNPATRGATGLLLGEVEVVGRQSVTFTSQEPLGKGDRLRIQPASDLPGTSFTLRSLKLGNRKLARTPAKSRVTIAQPPGVSIQRGDMVYKVASGQAYTLSEEAGRKRLAAVAPELTTVELHVTMPDNSTLQVRARSLGPEVSRDYPVEGYPASDRPLSVEVLGKVFGRTGEAPFVLGGLTCSTLPPLVIPPSRLNDIRRDFYQELTSQLQGRLKESRCDRRRQALAELVPPRQEPTVEEPQVCIVLGNVSEWSTITEDDELYLPLRPGALDQLDSSRRIHGRPLDGIIWDLPPVILEGDWAALVSDVEALVARGFKRFRLQNLGQFLIFDDLAGVEIEAGWRLFTLNSQAALAWRSLGATAATLSIEDDHKNLAELLLSDLGIKLSITAYASLAVMISRIPLHHVDPGQPVVSAREEAYRIEDQGGLTTVRPSKDFSLIGNLAALNRQGCNRFIIDLSHRGASSTEGQKILTAAGQDRAVPGTSSFNFTRGMT